MGFSGTGILLLFLPLSQTMPSADQYLALTAFFLRGGHNTTNHKPIVPAIGFAVELLHNGGLPPNAGESS